MRTYLDHNASSPLRDEVREAMAEALSLHGNPSSVHAEGRHVRALVERAREQVAELAGAQPRQVIFTSGGTEANVTALSPGNVNAESTDRAVCFIGAHEHPSVLAGGRFSADRVQPVGVTRDGVIDLDDLSRLVETHREMEPEASFMVSLMFANNETGALQPVAEAAALARENGGVLHCDAVQAAGKVPVDVGALGAHITSMSAHKIGGPQGVGALVLGNGMASLRDVLLSGGGQELRARSGTENVPGIVGFGRAAEIARREIARMGELAVLRDEAEQAIAARAPGAVIFSRDTARLPNTTCFAVPGMKAETLIIALDLAGIAVSAGSSCSSGKVEKSHVLQAMGVGDDLAAGAIRVSLGWNTTRDDIAAFIAAWSDVHDRFSKEAAAA